MDSYSTQNGNCTAQMKCPHCGEMIDLTAEKGQGGSGEMGSEATGESYDQELRQAMSPRNDDQTP